MDEKFEEKKVQLEKKGFKFLWADMRIKDREDVSAFRTTGWWMYPPGEHLTSSVFVPEGTALLDLLTSIRRSRWHIGLPHHLFNGKFFWWLRHNRLMRYLHCHHKWQKYQSEFIYLGSGNFYVFETLDLSRDLQFCSKCREIRMSGKRTNIEKTMVGERIEE